MSASASSSPYKPSPLGLGTPRSSPFRRPLPDNPAPDSPGSSSASLLRTSSSSLSSSPVFTTPTQPARTLFATPTTPPRPASPTSTPTPNATLPAASQSTPTLAATSPSLDKSDNAMFTAAQGTAPSGRESWTPHGSRISAAAELFGQSQSQAQSQARSPLQHTQPQSQSHTPQSQHHQSLASKATPPSSASRLPAFGSGSGSTSPGFGGALGNSGGVLKANAMSQLQPTQMRMLRDGFEVLDRDGDGVVNREDVADMLSQLGLPSDASSISQFFPPSSPQTTTLAAYLNSLASALADLSPGPELLSAFSAFDDDDSGQVDLAELRDALLHTAPDPGERALTASEVDRLLADFSGRRAFTKSSVGMGMAPRRGDVFRYQEFVGSIMGSGTGSEPAAADGV